MKSSRPLIVILGPTGCGKTDLALRLSRLVSSLPMEIISADAFQLYQGMDIGTASPTQTQRKQAPFHLLDIADPQNPFDCSTWLESARVTYQEILDRGHLPLLTGGTGLYAHRFVNGIFPAPPIPPPLRGFLRSLPFEKLTKIHSVLTPSSAQTEKNPRRMQRQLELIFTTGLSLEQIHKQTPKPSFHPLLIFILDLPNDILKKRLKERMSEMFQKGWLEEVKSLNEEQRLGPTAQAAIGYSECIEHLRGAITIEELKEKILKRSWKYVKRQRTFFRGQFQGITLDAREAEERIKKSIQKTIFF